MKNKLKHFLAILIIVGLCSPMKSYAQEDIATSLVSKNEAYEAASTEATLEEKEEKKDKVIEEPDINFEDEGKKEDKENKGKDESIPKLSSIEDARKGVVQVNCVYKDELGKNYIVQGGTGFLIGSSEDTEYVITNNHIVNPEKKVRDTAFKAIGVDSNKEWDKIGLVAQVVVEGNHGA